MFVASTAFAATSYVVSTLAGTGGEFQFSNPTAAVMDSTGNVFVTDSEHNVIRKITASGTVTTFAGAVNVSGNADGTGTSALFSTPHGLAIDGADNLYVADTGNHAIRMISPAGVVTTLAGTAGGANGSITVAPGYVNDTGTAARFNAPEGIATDHTGAAVNVYVADTQNHAIRQIVVSSKVVTTLAGVAPGGANPSGYVDDVDTTARFNAPTGLVSDSDGTNLYVTDTGNQRIRRIAVAAGPVATVTTLCGSGTAGYAEGTGTGASFNGPTSAALSGGRLLVSDTQNHVIRSVDLSSTVTTLFAGTPGSANTTDGMALTVARFDTPSGIVANGSVLFVVDTNNQRVRQISPAGAPGVSAPADVTVLPGGTATFTVTATGTPAPSLQWQRSIDSGSTWQNLTNGVGGVGGALTNQLVITGVTADMNGYRFRVVATNGISPDATSLVAALVVSQAPTISNLTTTYNVTVGQALQGMTVTASGSPTITFAATGLPAFLSLNSGTGAITGTPASGDVGEHTFTVTATNSVGTSPAVTFKVVVQNGPAITTQPADQSVTVPNAATFTVVASSTPAISGYQWQRSTNSGGTWTDITDGAPYSGATTATLTIGATTTGMNGYQFRVVVTNADGSSTSNAAVLSVSQQPVFTNATATSFVVNVAGSFTVAATGFPTPTLSLTGGTLPSWLHFDASTGILSGTPADTSGSPFTFVFTATSGSLTASQTFTLTVSATPLAPVVTTQPQNLTVGLGQNAAFAVTAAGEGTLTYQWQRFRSGDSDYVNLTDAGHYSGTGTATLTITTTTAEMSGDLYRVVVANASDSTTSATAQLTVTSGTVFSTVAGHAGTRGSTDGSGTTALFNAPTGIAVDVFGNMYVADTTNQVIRKVTPAGAVTTLAGTAGLPGSTDGTGSAARFSAPSGIAIDGSGTVYVADAGNCAIRSISPSGEVKTIAGVAGGFGNVDGAGDSARFSFPTGLAISSTGVLYVADQQNHAVRKIVSSGGSYSVTTIALLDGVGNAVTLKYPRSVAVDSSLNVYIADTNNHVIRKVTPGGLCTTLAGTVGSSGSADGAGGAARFNQPQSVAVDSSGNVYVADQLNHTIRRISPTGIVSTVGGLAGTAGTADGDSTTARFNQPYGVAVSGSGVIYVADTLNHTVRRSGAGTAPQITSQPQARTVRAGQNATFVVVASGVPAPSYQWQRQASGTDSFVNLNDGATYSGVNAATLTLTNATEAMNGDQFRVVVNNLVNPTATSSAVTLTVTPATAAPVITTQPASTTVDQGSSATFSVTAVGSGTLSYQWKKNGGAINGATTATFVLPNVQTTSAGTYTVVVSNDLGSAVSDPATLAVNSTPAFVTPPRAQMAVAGDTVTFTVGAAGGNLTYQWRKNGVAIDGATGATLTLTNVSAADVASYDVVITNSLGTVVSTFVPLTLVSGATAPVIVSQPASKTVVAGTSVSLSVAVMAAPAPTYQWRKGGMTIAGATNATLTIAKAQSDDAGSYDVVIVNSAGSVTSAPANLHVIPTSYAGIYLGSFSNDVGKFALYVRPDNTAVFLGSLPGSSTGIIETNLTINDNGQFGVGRVSTTGPLSFIISATIASDGTVGGLMSGFPSGVLSGSRTADAGATQRLAGFYMTGSTADGTSVLTIATATGSAFAVAQKGTVIDGGLGTLSTDGTIWVTTTRSSMLETITPATGAISTIIGGAITGILSGATETAITEQRLANLSSRAKVGGGDAVEIAGFVISGTESKTVLIRAVGPTLSAFQLTGVLATPKLDLYRGQTVVASNTGVANSPDAAAIAAAGKRSGGFDLGAHDSALLVTLPPGIYSAQVSGANGTTGLALVEVYDLSSSATGQKLINISTRAFASSGVDALIAGVIVNGTAPKRVLIRAVGPGLTQYNVSGVLAHPVLTLTTQSGQQLAQNTGWTTSPDAAAIAAANGPTGAFPLTTDDSALIVMLPPGMYSAQVTGANGTSGIALVEIYELQ